jgi:hypothetical protein
MTQGTTIYTDIRLRAEKLRADVSSVTSQFGRLKRDIEMSRPSGATGQLADSLRKVQQDALAGFGAMSAGAEKASAGTKKVKEEASKLQTLMKRFGASSGTDPFLNFISDLGPQAATALAGVKALTLGLEAAGVAADLFYANQSGNLDRIIKAQEKWNETLTSVPIAGPLAAATAGLMEAKTRDEIERAKADAAEAENRVEAQKKRLDMQKDLIEESKRVAREGRRASELERAPSRRREEIRRRHDLEDFVERAEKVRRETATKATDEEKEALAVLQRRVEEARRLNRVSAEWTDAAAWQRKTQLAILEAARRTADAQEDGARRADVATDRRRRRDAAPPMVRREAPDAARVRAPAAEPEADAPAVARRTPAPQPRAEPAATAPQPAPPRQAAPQPPAPRPAQPPPAPPSAPAAVGEPTWWEKAFNWNPNSPEMRAYRQRQQDRARAPFRPLPPSRPPPPEGEPAWWEKAFNLNPNSPAMRKWRRDEQNRARLRMRRNPWLSGAADRFFGYDAEPDPDVPADMPGSATAEPPEAPAAPPKKSYLEVARERRLVRRDERLQLHAVYRRAAQARRENERRLAELAEQHRQRRAAWPQSHERNLKAVEAAELAQEQAEAERRVQDAIRAGIDEDRNSNDPGLRRRQRRSAADGHRQYKIEEFRSVQRAEAIRLNASDREQTERRVQRERGEIEGRLAEDRRRLTGALYQPGDDAATRGAADRRVAEHDAEAAATLHKFDEGRATQLRQGGRGREHRRLVAILPRHRAEVERLEREADGLQTPPAAADDDGGDEVSGRRERGEQAQRERIAARGQWRRDARLRRLSQRAGSLRRIIARTPSGRRRDELAGILEGVERQLPESDLGIQARQAADGAAARAAAAARPPAAQQNPLERPVGGIERNTADIAKAVGGWRVIGVIRDR